MMAKILLAVACFVTVGLAHNSYTGGYSGAPGKQSCASSCHGGTTGTLVVTGFPASYQPLQTYRVVVTHNGGSKIVNFNATTRVGSSATVAGTFAAVTNSVLYTGADGGVHASPHAIDSAVFQWTAPATGTGAVNFYAAAFQGTTSSKNGESSKVTLSASQSATGVESESVLPDAFTLRQNFPNPFNPVTTIQYDLATPATVRLAIYNTLGQEVSLLVNEVMDAGSHQVRFDGSGLASGVYLYQLQAGHAYRQAGNFKDTKKFVLLR